MTGFMECRDPFLFVRDHTALLLCADAHFYKRFFDIILLDIRTVLFCSNNCRFIQQILKIRTGKSRCGLCDLF